jgi:hypothetical protein
LKVNAELVLLTYGALVSSLIKENPVVEEVNTLLENMGFNIGGRIVDEFMARSGAGRCHSFEETAEVLARTGFKMFLGTAATVVPQVVVVEKDLLLKKRGVLCNPWPMVVCVLSERFVLWRRIFGMFSSD